MTNQRHGFVAAETSRQSSGRRGLRQGWLPIEQGEDALPSGFGGGTEPAEVADALKALGQNVLEEAPKKLGGGEGKGAPLLVLALFVFEGDLSVLCFEDPLRTQSGVGNVGRQIFDGALAVAGGLDIHDPLLPPDKTWNGVGVW